MILAVLSQHAEDAAMLGLQRAAAVCAPKYSLKDLEKLDDRLEAQIDGLRIAGAHGWSICLEQLAFEEAGEVFAAGVLALESGEPGSIEKVFSTVEKVPETLPGFASAAGWLDAVRARPLLEAWLKSPTPLRRLAGVTSSAILRIDLGLVYLELLRDADARVRERACRALGELGRVDLVSHLARALHDPDEAVRFSAAWSLALLSSDVAAISALRAVAESGPAAKTWAERAIPLAIRRMDVASGRAWQKTLARNLESLRSAVLVACHLGDPELMPWIIDQMKVPELARVAGEAFTFITGVGIDYRDLDGPAPEGFEGGPTEDPADENVEMDPDEDLPWPHPKKIADWWQKNRGQCSC